MMKSRIFLHPLLSNSRSRSILISFAITIIGATAFLWLKLMGILNEAGLGFEYFRSMSSVPLLRLLLSPYFQFTIVLFSILLAAATTAISVVGPVKRLEQWLMDWDMGYTVSPLRPRSGDTYDNLIRLINDLYSVKKPKNKK